MIFAYFCISAFSAGAAICLLNIPYHGVNRLGTSGCPSHFLLRICLQIAVVAIHQPNDNQVTVVTLIFLAPLTFPISGLVISYWVPLHPFTALRLGRALE
jgi:hypothetical protein